MAIANLYRGNTKRYKFTFVDASGTAINIAAWTLHFTGKAVKLDSDANAIIDIQTTAGDDPLDDAANGLMYLTIKSTDSDVEPQSLYYDFKRVIPGSPNDVKTLDIGDFKILDIITLDA